LRRRDGPAALLIESSKAASPARFGTNYSGASKSAPRGAPAAGPMPANPLRRMIVGRFDQPTSCHARSADTPRHRRVDYLAPAPHRGQQTRDADNPHAGSPRLKLTTQESIRDNDFRYSRNEE